jgi:hypothetical protein
MICIKTRQMLPENGASSCLPTKAASQKFTREHSGGFNQHQFFLNRRGLLCAAYRRCDILPQASMEGRSKQALYPWEKSR